MKKKVLFITNIPSPYRVDFFNLWSKDVELTVIFEAKRGDRAFNWNDSDMKFNYFFLSPGKESANKLNTKIFKYLKKNRYDVIFINEYGTISEMAAIIYMQMARISYVLEVDGAIIRKKESFIKRALKKVLISNAKCVLSPSKESDNALKYYGVSECNIYRYPFTSVSCTDIINRVPSQNDKACLRKKYGITEEHVALQVGQIIHRKGIDISIKAAKLIDSNIGVVFLGGNITEEYSSLVEGLELSNVHFVPFGTTEIVKEFYQMADVFILPTREDIWGLVINEAMASGLPIITTKECVAGVELVNENGILLSENNEHMLANAISLIVNDADKRKQMCENSLQLISKYTIEEMVNCHNDFISEGV